MLTTPPTTTSFIIVPPSYASLRNKKSPSPFSTKTTFLKSSDDDETSTSAIDKHLIKAAKEKLPWETLQEVKSKPVLNLSSQNKGSGDLFLSQESLVSQDMTTTTKFGETEKDDDNNDNEKEEEEEKEIWQDGSVWFETRAALIRLNILEQEENENDENSFMWVIESVPQLLRLDTTMIINTTNLLYSYGFNFTTLSSSSSSSSPSAKMFLTLLTYPSDIISYSVQFLQNMMALPSKNSVIQVCTINPDFLLKGIEGAIQELHVKDALRDAGDAMYKANRKVAVDSANVLKEIRNKKREA